MVQSLISGYELSSAEAPPMPIPPRPNDTPPRNIKLFNLDENRGPMDRSMITEAPRVPFDVDGRIAKLRSYLNEYLQNQTKNIRTAIRLWKEGKLPSKWIDPVLCIQDGVVVPIQELQVLGKPYWMEVSVACYT